MYGWQDGETYSRALAAARVERKRAMVLVKCISTDNYMVDDENKRVKTMVCISILVQQGDTKYMCR
jgi:hypothetical protein